jgi:MFS family permease
VSDREGDLCPVWTEDGDGESDEPVRQAPPATLWRQGDFLRFWFGEAVSLAGTQVTQLALPLTAIALFGVGAEELGLLRMLQLIPFLLLSLPFGMLVDRHRRRPVMIWANVVRAIAIGLIPLLAALHQLHMSVVYVIAFAVGVVTVLFDVCFMSYVPALVKDKSLLVEANSKIGTTIATAEMVGPGAAGVLIQLVTGPIALVVDAVSYAVSVVMLRSIRTVEDAPKVPTGKRHLGAELFEGLRLVLGNPYLRTVTFVGAASNFVLTFVEAVFLVYAVNELRLGAGLIGVILSVGAVGAVLGTALAPQLIRRFHFGRLYAAAEIFSVAGFFFIPAAAGPRFAIVAVLMAGLFLTYVAGGVSIVIVISLRQVLTPHHVMARMTAASRMLLYGAAAFGGPVGGLLAGWLGLRGTLWLAALLAAASVLPIFLSQLPRMSALPEPSADDRMATSP